MLPFVAVGTSPLHAMKLLYWDTGTDWRSGGGGAGSKEEGRGGANTSTSTGLGHSINSAALLSYIRLNFEFDLFTRKQNLMFCSI